MFNASLQRKNADVFRFRKKKKEQAFKMEMSFWKRRIEQDDFIQFETVDENVAVQLKPLFLHI
jgi:hypothetical protein